ncbi:TGACG-sequence-specific DNA-binding protein TGA-2.1 [Hordeum vulgare]|nr:TGACG-sequence-specific DNA-binding protein TGA-2.1 [Hordeum vulgare]
MHVEPSPKGELGLVLSPVPMGSKMPSGRSSPDHHHHHQQQQAAAVAMEELAAGSRRQQQDHHLHLQHQQQQPAFATAESAGASNRDVKPLTKNTLQGLAARHKVRKRVKLDISVIERVPPMQVGIP